VGKIRVVVGAQYGSESKGRTAGFLLSEDVSPDPQLTIRVGGPQAGHIVVGRDPNAPSSVMPDRYHWKLRSVPVGAVCREDAMLAIASGSEIDPERLRFELAELDRAGYKASDRLTLDPMATWMTPEHKDREVGSDIVERIGSTSTGVGEARCDRVMRCAAVVRDIQPDYTVGPVRDLADLFLDSGGDVLIEAAQGCHLDLYRGPYPFATSGRTTAIDALASAEVVPWRYPQHELQVWLAVRVNPIRVGGNSGPLKGETTWEALGVEPEITTVTKRVRRVGEWDPDLVRQSVEWCGGAPTVRLSLSHLDYLFPEAKSWRCADDMSVESLAWIDKLEQDVGAPVALVGVAPDVTFPLNEGLL
jgi:adenylosuccinate synthase